MPHTGIGFLKGKAIKKKGLWQACQTRIACLTLITNKKRVDMSWLQRLSLRILSLWTLFSFRGHSLTIVHSMVDVWQAIQYVKVRVKITAQEEWSVSLLSWYNHVKREVIVGKQINAFSFFLLTTKTNFKLQFLYIFHTNNGNEGITNNTNQISDKKKQ